MRWMTTRSSTSSARSCPPPRSSGSCATTTPARLGDADLEERLLRNVDETQFRAICQNALEGLATKKLNLEMLIERRARAQEQRVVPETIARFLARRPSSCRTRAEAGAERSRTRSSRQHAVGAPRYEQGPGLETAALADRTRVLDRPRDGRDETAWSGLRRATRCSRRSGAHPRAQALDVTRRGRDLLLASARCAGPHRLLPSAGRGWPRARHPRAPVRRRDRRRTVSLASGTRRCSATSLQRPAARTAGGRDPAGSRRLAARTRACAVPRRGPGRAAERGRADRDHVELSLTELLQRADEEIGRAAAEVEQKLPGAEGRLAQAETRHAELSPAATGGGASSSASAPSRCRRSSASTSVLVLPHPSARRPRCGGCRPEPETEATAMRVAIEHEREQGRQVFDVSEKNLGYDVTSLDLVRAICASSRSRGSQVRPAPSSLRRTSGAWPRIGGTATGSTSSRIAPLPRNSHWSLTLPLGRGMRCRKLRTTT